MQIFYNSDINSSSFFLTKQESKHCIKVLRLKIGDQINIVDGKGGFYTAKIANENPNKCQVEITGKTENYKKAKTELSIAIAPTKNIARTEWFVEKATEIGIFQILPFTSFHSERRNLKAERLEKIAISAMKQSQKAYLPKISELQTFEQIIKTQFEGQKFISYCKAQNHLKNIIQPKQHTLLLIGPEGGFSDQEIELAKINGFQTISLGENRLRTETAAVVATTIFNLQ